MVTTSEPLRTPRGRKSSPINVSTSNWRRFSFGYRSVPPATNIACGPSSAAMRAASRAFLGRRYLKRGSLSNVEVLRWRFDLDRRRIRNLRESSRTVTRLLTLLFAAQRLDDLLGRDRDLVDPYPQRIVYGRADRGGNGKERSLSRLLRPVGTFLVDRLDEERHDLRHVEEGGRLVLQHRGPFVQALAKDLLLHQRLAQPHVDAALDLTLEQERVDRPPDVVGDPHLVDVHETRARVG